MFCIFWYFMNFLEMAGFLNLVAFLDLVSNALKLEQFLCLIKHFFVCLWNIVPLENFGLMLGIHTMAIEQWGFFNVSHLLWHDASISNCNLREPMTLTPVTERLAVELSLPFFTTSVCRGCNKPLYKISLVYYKKLFYVDTLERIFLK